MAEKQTSPFAELANRNLYRPFGIENLEFLPQLRGRKQSEVYREMSDNDALIGAILFAIEMVLRRVEWEVEPARSQDGEASERDMQRADFLNSCMEDMSVSWEDFVSDVLTMLPFGYSYMEIVYKRREDASVEAPAESRTRYPDGQIGWRKFVLVPQATIDDFKIDEYGGVQGAWQGGAYGEQRILVPIEKALLFRTSQRSPRGKSVLRRVVQSWYYRKRIQEIEGIGVERDLAGLPVMHVDHEALADGAKKTEYQNIIRNTRRDTQEGVLLPANVDEKGQLQKTVIFELLSTGGARQFNTTEIINRYAREIAVAVLQDIVILGHEKIGTQALASEKRDLSDTALQAWLNVVAAVMNTHAVPRLFALNGESLEDLPKLKPNDLRSTDVEEFFKALKMASDAGFVWTDDPEVEAFIRRKIGVPPMTKEMEQQRQDERDEDRELKQRLMDNPPPESSPNGNERQPQGQAG